MRNRNLIMCTLVGVFMLVPSVYGDARESVRILNELNLDCDKSDKYQKCLELNQFVCVEVNVDPFGKFTQCSRRLPDGSTIVLTGDEGGTQWAIRIE